MARAATLAVADPAERQNGTGRRMPVRTQEITFDWEGETWHATMRTNAPSGQVDALLGRDPDAYRVALAAVVLEWDFVDDEGEPIPLPKDGGVGKVSYPQLRALVAAYLDALAAPKD